MQVRASGVLLHITSLPSDYGIGDVGPWAFRFAESLRRLGQSYWQILPLSPTSPAVGNSPYSSASAFAGDSLLISPKAMVAEGYLASQEVAPLPMHDQRWALFDQARQYKQGLMRKAFERNRDQLAGDVEFKRFRERNSHWLDDFTLFTTLKERFNGAMWSHWPMEYRERDPNALDDWRVQAAEEIRFVEFEQFLFFTQWGQLKKHCNDLGVSIVGDVPIYVTLDSADVWGNHEIFKLDANREPEFVAGVPPDYFSKTGQRWGNPVYDWDELKKRGYDWWIKRMQHALTLYDVVRLDHFRGFSAYWEVPASAETAVDGEWVDGPGELLFDTLMRRIPNLPVIAEDLGLITADVRELKDAYGFPGMVILQFCFGPNLPENPYAPHNHVRSCVAYTGTHDNNTINGWYYQEASEADKQRFLRYAGVRGDGGRAHMIAIRLVMSSVANLAVFPMQDLLGFGSDMRMNTPSTSKGNWAWRALPEEIDVERHQEFRDLALLFGRA